MSDYQMIIDEVATILTEKTKIQRENLKPELHLEESGLDSFARIELVLAIEEHDPCRGPPMARPQAEHQVFTPASPPRFRRLAEHAI